MPLIPTALMPCLAVGRVKAAITDGNQTSRILVEGGF
jgi:hypothetical protein